MLLAPGDRGLWGLVGRLLPAWRELLSFRLLLGPHPGQLRETELLVLLLRRPLGGVLALAVGPRNSDRRHGRLLAPGSGAIGGSRQAQCSPGLPSSPGRTMGP